MTKLLVRVFALLTIAMIITGCGSGSDSKVTLITEPDEPTTVPVPNPTTQKNILLIISDDQGLDGSAQYALSSDIPSTSILNGLAQSGVVFENVWATPACTTSRASLLTGLYPHNSNVTFVPAILTPEFQTLPQLLENNTNTADYAAAVFGKWHLAGGKSDADHPSKVGIQHYAGNLFNIDDYYNWELTINGQTELSTEYHTSKITNLAIDWIAEQQTPWFAWLAYSAPHSPFHLPPTNLHNRDLSGTDADIQNNPRDYYLAAIEAMDTEIGRLFDSMDEEELANTLIIFIGDNGTPQRVIDTSVYATEHGKGSLYQGSLAVPLIVSGAGVERLGERESQLITITDLFASIAQAAGIDQSTIGDSHSFYPLLSDAEAKMPDFIFTEFESAETTGWTVRSASHKLIHYENGDEALFLLSENFEEITNLLESTVPIDIEQLSQLTAFAETIFPTQSNDPIDITNAILTNQSANCTDYASSYRADATDINRALAFIGSLTIEETETSCTFSTNAIPNHHFNDGEQSFPNAVSEQNDLFEITNKPVLATIKTPLSLTVDNAILLNGVKVDILAAGCFGVGDGKVGCNDMQQAWRYDPMHIPNGFRVDSHNAHSQPDGTYHYHGSPFALFDDNNDKASPVIGFAADGFPIFGSYFENEQQQVLKAQSSYRLKSGNRPSEDGSPGGSYDGSFRDDYEYAKDLGDLDECNGMIKESNYRYYITSGFPYVLGCFSGTPHQSFTK